MRIIFAANNSINSNFLMDRFVSNLKNYHEIKIAAYNKSSFITKEIDWTLDCLFEDTQTSAKHLLDIRLNKNKFPALNVKRFEFLINDIKKFNPDLIISDCEGIISNIANYLKIDFIYYSNKLILNKIAWKSSSYLKYFHEIKNERFLLKRLPQASSSFCVTPFTNLCKDQNDVVVSFPIKQSNQSSYNFKKLIICNDPNRIEKIEYVSRFNDEWALATYLDISGDKVFSLKDSEVYKKLLAGCDTVILDGDSVHLTDAIFNQKKIIMIPSMDNFESKMNASVIERNSIGLNIGQFELMDKFSLSVLQKAIDEVKPFFFRIKENTIKDFLNGS